MAFSVFLLLRDFVNASVSKRIPFPHAPVIQNEDVGLRKLRVDFMEEVLFRLHERGFRVADENEDVGVQAMLIDPRIQVRRHVDTGRIHEHHVVLRRKRAGRGGGG